MIAPIQPRADDGAVDPLILDACVVINLYATRRMDEILLAQELPVVVPSYVNRIEALWVGHGRKSDPSSDAEAVELAPMVERQIISFVAAEGNTEVETLIGLASQLDDGEAECGAIAYHRGFTVATDDRKAIRVFSQLNPPVKVVRTSQLIEHWERSNTVPRDVVKEVLRNIGRRARFEPPIDDPLNGWWLDRAA